jgi:meiotic recombination protein SPO11|mmetsp:Transcript_17522/g.37906  ORF Transcript_17522/g.37906 Transcript_17522/m.37906 type:complete len:103 (-) Transcript_17522:1174-1482(-)
MLVLCMHVNLCFSLDNRSHSHLATIRYDLPDQCRLNMTENDIKTGKELLQEAFIMKNPKWMKELQIMVKTKQKAEIQALSSFGFQYITEVYLPRKLKEGDWI